MTLHHYYLPQQASRVSTVTWLLALQTSPT
jgi:hypothetical protein